MSAFVIKKSKYKGVSLQKIDGKYEFWVAHMFKWIKYCYSEREAAMEYDKKLIELGKKPVNILKIVK